MDELTKDWKKLSLSSKEDNKFDLSKNKKTQTYTLAAKFLTCRSVNIEAVAKTFRPLGRMRKKFEVNNAADNILLLRSNLMRILKRSLWENLGRSIDIWWFSKGMICLLRLRI